MMQNAKDLDSEAFSYIGNWPIGSRKQKVPGYICLIPSRSEVLEHLKTIFSAVPETEIELAIGRASALEKAVQQNPFYHEPYPTVHAKIIPYLKLQAPGLSERAYSLAESAVMYGYLH